ncbi:uncharacterized protein LOC101238360 [Hydra vulgaris]|uniref:Uncharacterized protein LOC101238360 n=1 Tax=Hydra vulgaris TaxID=6087 RepID=A0ABM4DE42_HYDVU
MIFLLLLVFSTVKSLKYKPRCNLDFLFDGDLIEQNKISWERNCSSDIKAICKKSITISYFSMPPFTDDNTFSKNYWPFEAILTQIISAGLSQCCGNCLQIVFNKVDNRSQLTDVNTKIKSDIVFPMFTQGAPNRVNTTRSPSTIPIIKLSTAMFITTLSIPPQLFARDVLIAIYNLWPLFGVSIMLAFTSGVVMWYLDTWYNKEQLPRRFIPGSFEGFWWAFVSMTTVGYGDISPKGHIAKIYAMFWILCGITITALMTAALTTAINDVSKRYEASVNSGDIGILNNHIFEKVLLMKGNAKQHYMDTVDKLIEKVIDVNKPISGFLVDSYTAKNQLQTHMKKSDNNLFIRNVIDDVDQSYYGVAIYDEFLYDLFNEYLDYQKDLINDFVYKKFNNLPDISNPIIEANILFTTQSGIYKNVLICSACMILFLLFFGAIYELCSLKMKAARVHSRKTNLSEEELKIENEIKLITEKWKKKLPEFVLEGTFKVRHNEETIVNLTIKKKEDVKEEKLKEKIVNTTTNIKTKKSINKNVNGNKQNDFHIYINNDKDKNSQTEKKTNKKRPLPKLQP